MQQRGAHTHIMDHDTENEDLTAPQASSRGRNNSKLANKLVRSHAMREEASPPREVLIAAAAAAAAAASQTESSSPASPSPNTLSPPIQHRIRSPDLSGGGSTAVAHVRRDSGSGGNPLLVLSPSTSPSMVHHQHSPHTPTATTTASTTPSTSPTTILPCSYHHHTQHQQCNHQYHNTTISPTNGSSATNRCCSSPQQLLLTVDYVSGGDCNSGADSGDDNRIITDGVSSHKVNKLNRQNLESCPNNKQRSNHSHSQQQIILEESSSQQHATNKIAKCDCIINNNYNHHHQPSPDRQQQHNNVNSANNSVSSANNQLTVNRAAGNRAKLRQQSSSQSYGSFDGSHSSLSASPYLSRDNSSEQYTDTTGVDLETFIPETLNRNMKDRALMLRIEEELLSLAKDQNRTHYKFPPMSSYQRMLVHRCAAYFGMDHNIESSGKCVVVNRTKATRIPTVPFKEHFRNDVYLPDRNYSNAGSATGSTTSLVNHDMSASDQQQQLRRSILKRGDNSGGSMDEMTSGGGRRDMMMLLSAGNGDKRSKSFEEREEEYAKVRRRIFNHDHRGGSQDEFRWSDVRWPSTDSDVSTRNKLHPMEHYHAQRCRNSGRLQKVQSEEKGEDTLRPCVAKSYSFGGYGGCFTRGDSIMSTHSASPRLLTKQDSSGSSTYHRSSQLSPSSSGYKTQSSQRSTESVTPSPTSTPYLPTSTSSCISQRQDSTNTNVSSVSNSSSTSNNTAGGNESDGVGGGQQMVFWAVTDVDSVPRGSVIINPQTGMAVRNDDGTVYRYDPGNPPAGMGGCSSAANAVTEKHSNHVETKQTVPEPLLEEPALSSSSSDVILANHSPKRQHGNGKPPLSSPSHHYHENCHHQIEQQLEQQQQQQQDVIEHESFHHQQQQQQQEMVESSHIMLQGPESSSQMLHSPSHNSPQRRRKNSPFRKQEVFSQPSIDKPIMVSTYTSTTNSPSLPYSPPPPPSQVAQASTPRPSRPSSVLSQQSHHPQHLQQPTRYTNVVNPMYLPAHSAMAQHQQQVVEQQQQQQAYMMSQQQQQQPILYPDAQTVVYGQQQQQQPCFVYGYGVPVPTPMDNGMGDMGVGGYYIADGAGAGAITYQAAWAPNQAAISYFAAPGVPAGAAAPTVGPPPPGARFSVPMQPSYIASPYTPTHHAQTNYITCPAAPQQPPGPPTDLIPLYSPGQPAVVYAQQQQQHQQLYPPAMYGAPPQQQQQSLQQQYYSASSATSTPTGHHNSGFSYPSSAQTPPTPTVAATSCSGAATPIPMMFGAQGLVHGIGQMSLAPKGQRSLHNHPSHHLDRRNSMQRMQNKPPFIQQQQQRNNLQAQPGCSSQSSTEPSSPATTVIPSPYSVGAGSVYRLPPGGAETPPFLMGGPPPQHFLPPQQQQQQQMLIRPMNTVQSSPPITTMNRSSRSPTPASSDISLVGERPKFPALPAGVAGVYHPAAMPFMIPADVRFGMRAPSGSFRQMSPHQRQEQQQAPGGMDRGVRNRKPRGNRQYLPPNGRPNF